MFKKIFKITALTFFSLISFASLQERVEAWDTPQSCSGKICVSLSVYSTPIYPGDSYQVRATISNSGSSSHSGSVTMYWGYDNHPQGSFCTVSYTAPANGSVTVPSSASSSCKSTGDVAGSTIYFQANSTANNGQTIWTKTSYTVSTRPVATASISGPGSPIPYNTSADLTVSSNNANSCSVSPQGSWVQGTVGYMYSSGTWNTGNLTSNKTFTVSCNADAGATGYPVASVTVNVGPPPKSDQTITFNQPGGPATYNSTFTVSPTSSSGLTVSVSASGGCSISGNTVTMTSGTTACTLTASQSGNDSYNAATSVVRTVSASKADQTISFGTLSNRTLGSSSFTVSASASSGLSVSWSSLTTNVCTVSGSTVTLKTAGTCTIRASQGGDANYNAAPSVDRSFTVSNPNNVLGIVTKLDSGAYGGVSITQVSGSPAGFGGTTSSADPSFYTKESTSDINVTLRAAETIGSNLFSSWSGCDFTSGVSGNDCTVIMSGGANKTITATYVSPANQPNTSVTDIQIKGGKYDGSSYYVQDISGKFLVSVSNSGFGTDYDPTVSIRYRNGTEDFNDSRSVGKNLEGGRSANVDFDFGHLPTGTMTATACANPGTATERCLTKTFSVGNPPAPSPAITCIANFTNRILDRGSYWNINVDVNIDGCPTSRYTGLWVHTTSDVVVDVTFAGTGLFKLMDTALGAARSWVSGDCRAMATADPLAIVGSGGASLCGGTYQQGGSLDFIAIKYLSPTSGFYTQSFTESLVNSGASGRLDFNKSALPWGNYQYNITNKFYGNYACSPGYTYTSYSPTCDPLNSASGGSSCSQPSSSSYPPSDWRPFGFDLASRACAEVAGSGTYYDSSCSPSLSPPQRSDIICGGEPKVNVTTTPPNNPTKPIFIHTLEVRSTKGGVSKPGVIITQVGSAVAVNGSGTETSGTVSPREGGNFGGTTNYSKTAERNFKVTLEAPATHTTDGGSFSSWGTNDCDSLSPNGRQCTVILKFDSSGGKTRTITADYKAYVPPTADLTVRKAGVNPYGNGPLSLDYNGYADLQWTSSNATSCSAAWTSQTAANGTQLNVGPHTNSTYTYSITCSGPGGQATDSVAVNVLPQRPVVSASSNPVSDCGGIVRLGYTGGNLATSYKLHRSPYSATNPNSGWGQIAGGTDGISLSNLQFSYASQTGLAVGQQYSYQLEAINAYGSSWSDISSATSQKCFDYSLSNGGNISVTAGGSVSNTITRTLAAGVPAEASQDVTLSFSSSPAMAGATATFSPAASKPTSASALNIATALGTTAPGTYTITVTGTPLNKTTSFTLTVGNPDYVLALSKSGNGSVTSSPAGISCGAGCSSSNASYQYNTSVTLTASPDSGWTVSSANWTGCASTANTQDGKSTCSVTMSQARSVAVMFTQLNASVDLKAGGSDNLSTIPYGTGTYLTWSSSNMVSNSCYVSASPAASGYPKSALPTSHSGTSYYTGALSRDTTFTITCTKVAGTAGTNTDSVPVKVGVGGSGGTSCTSCTPSVTPISVRATPGACGSGNMSLVYSGGSNATLYKLHRNPYTAGNPNSGWGQIAGGANGIPLSDLTRIDGGLTAKVLYKYQLQAIVVHSDGTTDSGYSNESDPQAVNVCPSINLWINNGTRVEEATVAPGSPANLEWEGKEF